MLKQVLKRDNALLGQMFIEASLNCSRMGKQLWVFFLVLLLKESSLTASHLEYGTGKVVDPVG